MRSSLRDPREDYDGYPVRAPSPGIAAVLSVLIPGLGQVYNGRLAAAVGWFLVTGFGYWAILIPGFALHAACVYCAYRGALDWRGYS
jgi:TM2 domain-containing membrane protein YozV